MISQADLDERWMAGGWTSHFHWRHDGTEAHLDVFGLAPRSSIRWERELDGLYVNRHTVAEKKRTNRDKDWPFATALVVETHFWHELDRIRIRIYEQAVRPYRSAVMRENLRDEPDLTLQHEARVRCAEQHLPINPLAEYGFDRMLSEAYDGVRDLGEKWLDLLPDVRENFEELLR